jgi:hypothetical protein
LPHLSADFRSSLKPLNVKGELPIKVAVEEGSIKEKTKKALLLGNLISRSAISSLRQDAKVTKITAILRTHHIQSLTNYRVTALSILQYDSLVADIVDKDGQTIANGIRWPIPRYPFGVIETLSCPKYRPDASSQLLEWHLSVLVALGKFQLLCSTVQANDKGSKSQPAIEYSYQVRESSPDMRVFWVHASSAARLEEGYRDIAKRAKIAVWDNPEANILSRDVAFGITGDTRDILPVDPMDDRIAVDLLHKKLQGDFNENDAKAPARS